VFFPDLISAQSIAGCSIRQGFEQRLAAGAWTASLTIRSRGVRRLDEMRSIRLNREVMPTLSFRFAGGSRRGFTAVLLLFVSGCGERSVETLTDVALNGPAHEQEKAALELSERGPAAIVPFRRIMAETKSPDIRAIAIQALGVLGDVQSMPALFEAMDDADPQIRSRAGVAASRLLRSDYHFRTEDPPAKRKAIIGQMREAYDQLVMRRLVK
jgi:HEAT repeats